MDQLISSRCSSGVGGVALAAPAVFGLVYFLGGGGFEEKLLQHGTALAVYVARSGPRGAGSGAVRARA